MRGIQTKIGKSNFGQKELFVITISILFLTDIAVLLDIPFLRQIFGFLFLTILPGVLVLKILKLNKIGLAEKVLLSVGLSISFLMLVGLIMNTLYPLIGISRPISTLPLISTITITLFILSVVAYNKNAFAFSIPISNYNIHAGNSLLSPILLIFLIPLLSILGALVVQYYQCSIFSLLQIAVIVLVVALICLDKFIPQRLYPLALFMIGTALILNRTLTSPFLFGSDIHYEYYFHNLVQINSYWNPTAPASNCNAMLSTVMLPTIYSILLNMDGIWVYKIIYSLIFGIVPVGLYLIYRMQIGDRDAFLSAFLVMSFYTFFTIMCWLPRQQIAELFLVLIVLLMMHKEMEPLKKSFLVIIFVTSLIVSHYAVTYIFLFYLLMTFAFLHFVKTKDTILTTTLVTLSIVIALSWYIYISRASVFSTIVHMGDHIYTAIATEMFCLSTIDPDIAMAFGSAISELTLWHAAGHCWQIITQFLIIIGFFYTILKRKETKFYSDYLLFSLISMVLILMCIVLPYFASSMNMSRIYHLTLLFLSPFCIIGTGVILKMTSRLFKVTVLNSQKVKYSVLIIILVPYLLFNTGFIFEVTEHPENIQLNISPVASEHARHTNYHNWSYFISGPPIPEQDVVSCKWISGKIGDNAIYADALRKCEVTGYSLILEIYGLAPTTLQDNYIFLGFQNVKEGIMYCIDPKIVHSTITYNITEISPPLGVRNKIYTNGGSEIYR